MLPFVGAITMWAGAASPDIEKKFEAAGWLICDGRAVSKKKYSDLFNVIGNAYGSGQAVIPENFFLPDFGGRAAIGANTAEDAKRNQLSIRKVGEQVGEEMHKLTIAEMPNHHHSSQGYTGTDHDRAGHRDGLFGATNPGTGPAGEDMPHNTMQPSLTVTFLIQFRLAR